MIVEEISINNLDKLNMDKNPRNMTHDSGDFSK